MTIVRIKKTVCASKNVVGVEPLPVVPLSSAPRAAFDSP